LESYTTRQTACCRQFRFYVVAAPDFPSAAEGREALSFESAASPAFLSRAVPETLERYRKAWKTMDDSEVPYISVSERKTPGDRIMIGTRRRCPADP
jgi:hypothetical protein